MQRDDQKATGLRRRTAAQATETSSLEGAHATPSTEPTPSRNALASGTLFFLYASLAGTCGALSAVVGKIAVASALAPRVAAAAIALLTRHGMLPTLLLVLQHLPYVGPTQRNDGDAGSDAAVKATEERLAFVVEYIFRTLFFVANAYFTGQMWRFFLKSLSLGPTPVSQIINTGTNFAVSAFLGLVFFREEVNVMWAVGALMVVLGLALVVTDPHAAKATAA